MIISRKFGNNKWTVEELLFFMNEELQARERCHPIEKVERNPPSRFSTECLLTETKQVKGRCVFCLQFNHNSSKCHMVTNVNARVNILKKHAKCFICLQSGHLARDCTSNYLCRKCNKRHHILFVTKQTMSWINTKTQSRRIQWKTRKRQVKQLQAMWSNKAKESFYKRRGPLFLQINV